MHDCVPIWKVQTIINNADCRLMESTDVDSMMTDPAQTDLQAREMYRYKREHLRNKINKRTQDRLRRLTTRADYRYCITAAAPAQTKRSAPANTPANNSATNAKAVGAVLPVIDISMLSDGAECAEESEDEEVSDIQGIATKRQRVVDVPAAEHNAVAAAACASPNPTPRTHLMAVYHDLADPKQRPDITPIELPEIPEFAKVPTMTLQHLIDKLMSDKTNMTMDPHECGHSGCAYCTGCIMGQRYALAKRLVQLEMRLYGNYP